MSKLVRIVLGIAGVLVVIAGIAVWLLVSNLDSIVRRVVEDVGSATLGTTVSLDSATVSLGDASAVLRGLSIANPRGFDAPHAFQLGAIAVSIDPASATTNEIVLPKIVVDQARLAFEQKGANNNLQTLLNNIDSGAGESGGSGSGDEADDIRLVIREFQLNGAEMTLQHDQLAEPINFTLPDIVLRDIGRVGAGVTAEEAVRQIIDPVLDKAMAAAKVRAKQEIEGLARQELDQQKDKAMDSMRNKLFGR
jgi:uncharacterized protein involved in outer membrane biogenesis